VYLFNSSRRYSCVSGILTFDPESVIAAFTMEEQCNIERLLQPQIYLPPYDPERKER
jgi:hypothetical protein